MPNHFKQRTNPVIGPKLCVLEIAASYKASTKSLTYMFAKIVNMPDIILSTKHLGALDIQQIHKTQETRSVLKYVEI